MYTVSYSKMSLFDYILFYQKKKNYILRVCFYFYKHENDLNLFQTSDFNIGRPNIILRMKRIKLIFRVIENIVLFNF